MSASGFSEHDICPIKLKVIFKNQNSFIIELVCVIKKIKYKLVSDTKPRWQKYCEIQMY